MTRLIDADALRDALQYEIDKATPPFDDIVGAVRCGIRLSRNIAEDQPTVDAVPVVRCKDCKYRDEQSANCTRFRKDWYVQSNSFCSWAERKE